MPWNPSDATKHTKKATTAKLRKKWAAVANSTRTKCISDGGDAKKCDARAIRSANSSIIKEVDMSDITAEAPIKPETDAQEQVGPEDTDVVEFFGYGYDEEQPRTYSRATTFADLDAEREIADSVQDIRADTADLWMMVREVLWTSEVEDKLQALSSLFAEYLTRVEVHLGETPEEGDTPPAVENAEVALEEQTSAISLTETTIEDLALFDALLTEQHVELANPRRAPVMVDFAIIQAGHGNKKDKRYYPDEMLAREDTHQVFEGVDIFVTNHDPNEKTERNKVGKFRSVSGLTEQGLVGTAILYDPDVAEKARNRADADELGTLHCSILASGTGKKADIDGQQVTVIEAITQVHSVDLVSRAGAGGHAIGLSEADGGTMDKQDQTEDQPLAEDTPAEEIQPTEPVTIRENEAGDAQDTPPEDNPVTEDEDLPPQFIASERVTELLAASGLSEKAQRWISGQSYTDEAEIQETIVEMRDFISALAPSAGQPFALGELAPPQDAGIPKILTAQELEERARERTRNVIAELDPSYAGNL